MKIRVMGTADECATAVEQLRQVLDVLEVSGAFPNRGESRQVRVYLEARTRPHRRREDEPMTSTIVEVDDDLAAAVRYTARLRTGFYLVVLLVALAGQVTGAIEALHMAWYVAAPAVGALELGGMVVLSNADVRRRLGERAVASRILSAGIAAFAVTFNWLGHANHLQGGFYAGMSALGYLVWLMSTENARRDRLRAKGQLPPTAPAYPAAQWARHPWLTRRARHLALIDPTLGLYGSLACAASAVRTERRQAAISDVLRRKIAASADRAAAEIAVTVYDLDEIARRLAGAADYDGLTALIAADLNPARLLAAEEEPAGPGSVALTAHVPPVLMTEVREAVAAATTEKPRPADTPEATAPSPRTSVRRKPAARRAKKPVTSSRRSAEETRQAAAEVRAKDPGLSQAEVARLLGISATRLRQVERPVNGTEARAAG